MYRPREIGGFIIGHLVGQLVEARMGGRERKVGRSQKGPLIFYYPGVTRLSGGGGETSEMFTVI